MPKHIPAYARIWHGALEEFPHAVDSVLRAARTAMGRRNVDLTPAMERLLRRVYELTSPERSLAITRSHEKRQARWDAMTHTV